MVMLPRKTMTINVSSQAGDFDHQAGFKSKKDQSRIFTNGRTRNDACHCRHSKHTHLLLIYVIYGSSNAISSDAS